MARDGEQAAFMAQKSQTSSQEDPRSFSQLQAEAQESEQRFRVMFDQAAVGMAHIALDGHWIYVNQRLCDITGYSQEELQKMTFRDISHPDDLHEDNENGRRLLAGEITVYSMEKRYILKNGSMIWTDKTVSLVRDEEGQPQYFVVVIEDIDERKRLETKLYRQQQELQQYVHSVDRDRQRFYSLFLQVPAFVCLFEGPEHVYAFANPLYLQLVGNRDIVGKPIRDALPELAGQQFYDLLDHVYTTGETFEGNEVKVTLDRHNNGKLKDGYFNFVYQATRDEHGVIDGIFVHAVEVTEQVVARESLSLNQQRLQLAQRAGNVGTFEWDIARNRHFWTPELEALYGLEPGSFRGDYAVWARCVHPDDLPAVEENLNEVALTGRAMNMEFRALLPDGTMHWLLAKGEVTSFDKKGKPTRMVGVNIDITERKKAEAEKELVNQQLQDLNATLEERVSQRTEDLNQLNLELQRSNQELQNFAYVASHDLQEPLRKIQAFGNLLEEEYGAQLGEGQEYLDRMRNAATRMRTLIDDLLTFSRVTTKAVPFVPIDLNPIVQQVIDDLEPRLQQTGGHIECAELPIIEADPGQMYQLFQNLLANALKFHRPDVPPVVKIAVTMQDEVMPVSASGQDGEPEQCCVLLVEDNGIGFEEKYLDRIFTVFQRLHGKNEFEGTGIGLAVVRKIVERHGGLITAQSTPGEGSTFIVTLPMQHIS
jgi:PAS domain S-box-containing protein